MKKNSKKHILLLSASGVLLICLISIYLSRNALLRSIVDKRTSHIEQTHGLRIHYDNLEMNGLNEIILEGLSVVPEQRDTLLTLTSTRVKLNFWKLLSRKIKIRYVAADGITLAFTKRDSVANYDFLFRKKLEYLTRTSPQTAPPNKLRRKNQQNIKFMLWFYARKRTTKQCLYHGKKKQ